MPRSLLAFAVILALFWSACAKPTSLAYPLAQDIEPAVVRVFAIACSFESEGTGVLVDSNLAITNAHVVAGAEQVVVHLQGGSPVTASVVGFDPVTDLALLRTDREPSSKPASIATVDPVDGDLGLVAVFSNQGRFVTVPYEVRRSIVASGTDIYGGGKHFRQALDLNTIIQPGDSGAGLFNQQNEIIGIAFASSTSETSVTYAIAASELREFLAGTDPLTTADSGTCLG